MGIVYLCETPDGEHVAVKRLDDAVTATPGARDAFLRECQYWILLGRHPNVVQALWATDPAPESPIIGAEHVRDSLRDVVRERTVGISAAVGIWQDLCRGLAYARERIGGFVHGDLKPENIMITPDGTAKITDFGLARAVAAVTTGGDEQPDPAVSSAVGGGTPLYMAPEQIQAVAVPESDVYAFGCIVHELLSGGPAYGPPRSTADYLLRHLYREPVPLPANVPAPLAELILACLRKDASARPALEDLEAALGAMRPHPPAGPSLSDEDAGAAALNAARGLVQLGFPEDGLAVLDRVPPLSGSAAVMALQLRTRLLNDFGRHDEAVSAGQAALGELERHGLGPDRDKLLRGAILSELGRAYAAGDDDPADLHRAAATFAEAARLMNASMLYTNLGLVLRRLDRPREAVDALTAALSISRDLRYYRQLVHWLVTDDRTTEAMEWADQAVEAHPASPYSRSLRAWALGMQATRSGLDTAGISRLREDVTFLRRLDARDEEMDSVLAFAELVLTALPH